MEIKTRDIECRDSKPVYDIDDFIFANEPYYESDK